MVQRAPRVQRPVGHRATGVRRGAEVTLVAFATLSLAGCQYLLGLSGVGPGPAGPFGSFDPAAGFSFPAPLAVFTEGTATVKVAGATATLDHLSSSAAIYRDLGTEVIWTDGKGEYLRLFGDGGGVGWHLTLDRIENASHWTTHDPTDCSVRMDHADATGVKGTASCMGLRWTDMMAAFVAPEPPYVPGEKSFDAEITFEATP